MLRGHAPDDVDHHQGTEVTANCPADDAVAQANRSAGRSEPLLLDVQLRIGGGDPVVANSRNQQGGGSAGPSTTQPGPDGVQWSRNSRPEA